MEPHDIPMMAFHYEFCGLLKGLLHAPWMDKDDWTVKAGPWVNPTPKPDATIVAQNVRVAAELPKATNPEASKWGLVRKAVVVSEEATGGGVDAAQGALRAFGGRAKQHRLRSFFGLTDRAQTGELLDDVEERTYVAKMKDDLFIIPA